jgi:hypothetical protein|tara:strand:+ start:132 stop:437 length:306 start_codon:yes stop_codon:yes gene_type:complete
MKTNAKDIIFTTDLQISGGDFLVSESDGQSIEHILRADVGQFRQSPLVGVGLQDQNNASVEPQKLKQKIKLQLKADGFSVKKVSIIAGEVLGIDIDAKRVK